MSQISIDNDTNELITLLLVTSPITCTCRHVDEPSEDQNELIKNT